MFLELSTILQIAFTINFGFKKYDYLRIFFWG